MKFSFKHKLKVLKDGGKRENTFHRNSLEHFTGLFQQSELFGVLVDYGGNVVYCNPSFLQRSGFESGLVVGSNWFHQVILIPEVDVPNALKSGINLNLYDKCKLTQIQGAHGTSIYIKWNYSVLTDNHESTSLLACIGEDITEKINAEVALKEALMINEHKYRYLFQNNPQSMWIYDLETLSFLEVNKAAELTYGFSRDEFLSMTLKDIRPIEDIDHLLEDVKNTGSVFNKAGEWRHQTKSGKVIDVEITSHSIVFESRKARLVIATDITQRKTAEKRLKTLSLAVEQSPASIIITDAEGKIEFVNAKFISFMQYSMNEVKGRRPRVFNSGHVPKSEYERMWEILRRGDIWQGEYLNRKKDKTEFWENVLISPLIENGFRTSNYILIMEDITEKKKLLNDLIIAKEKAEESDRLKTAFLQNMSHEIRTPMNAIVGFSELLAENTHKTEKVKCYANIIKQRSDYLLEIINDILEFARIESGQLPIHIEECNPRTLLEEVETVIHELRVRTQKQHIVFKMSPLELGYNIRIDEVKLKQILINLISNAFKFTHEGFVEVTCEVLDNNFLKFNVRDTGIGVPTEKSAEIFERFKQANDISKVYGGTGLGLSIVKGLLDMLGGKIWLESEQGKGSTFYFTMPYLN